MGEAHQMFDRKLLRARRARFACEIGTHEFLLDHVAREIAERVEVMLRAFPIALDLGAYRGLLGRRVAALRSVGAMIYAESSYPLAALCPRPALVCEEDLLPLKDASLNLVVSGLALHRVNDLPGALVQIRRALCPDGLFLAALLGVRSLIELREALIEAEAEGQGGASPRVAPFGDVRDYGALLQRTGFALPVADADVLKVTYASPRELMREVRVLGGGNVLSERSKAPLPVARSIAPKRFIASATRCLAAALARPLRSSIYRDGRRMRASRSRFRPAAPRRASPTLSARPSGRPATRHLSPWRLARSMTTRESEDIATAPCWRKARRIWRRSSHRLGSRPRRRRGQ